MFTGIIETMGRVETIAQQGDNITFEIVSIPFLDSLHVDQSIAHNGCCLSVTSLTKNGYTVTAIRETLQKTNLSAWKVGTVVNLERCLVMNARLDGHIVQGHIDSVGICRSIEHQNGSYKFVFSHGSEHFTVEKGSIAVNGVSLTVVDSHLDSFSVCIIPLTYERTNLKYLQVGDQVNLEFDIIGKYVARMVNLK